MGLTILLAGCDKTCSTPREYHAEPALFDWIEMQGEKISPCRTSTDAVAMNMNLRVSDKGVLTVVRYSVRPENEAARKTGACVAARLEKTRIPEMRCVRAAVLVEVPPAIASSAGVAAPPEIPAD